MATFDSDSLKPTSAFVPDSLSLSSLIPSGVTGVIATITPPANKRAALTMLWANAAPQAGISVVIDGTTVVPVGSLHVGAASAITTAGSFSIGMSSVSATVGILVAKKNGVSIQIVKNAGNTTQEIVYASAIGD